MDCEWKNFDMIQYENPPVQSKTELRLLVVLSRFGSYCANYLWCSYIPGTQLLGTFNVRIFLAMMEEDAREPTRESLLLEILWDHIATTVL